VDRVRRQQHPTKQASNHANPLHNPGLYQTVISSDAYKSLEPKGTARINDESNDNSHRNIALQPSPRGELPAEFLPHLEALLSEAGNENRSRSSSPAPISSLSPRPSSQANTHSSTAKQERKEMPLDDIAHCGEPEILAEVKVFQCAARCPNRPHRRGVAVGRGQ
jgi:hypothetical protein